MPIESWRCPIVLQVKSAVFAAAGAVVSAVFFPLWFAIPVAAALGVWGIGMCVRRGGVLVDADAGVVQVRMGPVTRRIRLAGVTALGVDRAKVSIARSDGGEISFYAWRKSRLDGWLRVPVVAEDVAHVISKAAVTAASTAAASAAGGSAAPASAAGGSTAPAGAAGGSTAPASAAGGSTAAGQEAGAAGVDAAAVRSARTRTGARASRGPLALGLLSCIGVVALCAAFLVRLSWPSPVMTAIGVILALGLGVSGVFYVMFSLWMLVTGRTSRDQASVSQPY